MLFPREQQSEFHKMRGNSRKRKIERSHSKTKITSLFSFLWRLLLLFYVLDSLKIHYHVNIYLFYDMNTVFELSYLYHRCSLKLLKSYLNWHPYRLWKALKTKFCLNCVKQMFVNESKKMQTFLDRKIIR